VVFTWVVLIPLCLLTDEQSVETLLSLAETYIGYGRDVSQQGAGGLKGESGDLKTQFQGG